jgi:hypothetical protein
MLLSYRYNEHLLLVLLLLLLLLLRLFKLDWLAISFI